MPGSATVLLVGTADTKSAELQFMQQCIREQGGQAIVMDVGVLGGVAPGAPLELAVTRERVAQAAGTTIQAIAQLGDENAAMQAMAKGAVAVALELYRDGKIDALLALGGTMGTDLALDLASALPLGMPKFIVSTVAFSHLIPPNRLAPDLMMILWAGGLYGLNTICQSILSQAAGAVLGASKAVVSPKVSRPRVAIGSLGKSCLNYMTWLSPELEKRGYEPVVFHCTGMGGQAMEALIEQRAFVAVFDFALAELSNWLHGSVVHAGAERLLSAGRRAVPQLVAPGASDMVDVQDWAPLPAKFAGRSYHAHNRLIGSVLTTAQERRALARMIAERLNNARGPTAFLLPRRGIHAWDLPGQPMHDAFAHGAFANEFRESLRDPVQLIDLDLHINDREFVDAALRVFDGWVAKGLVTAGAQS